MTSNDIRPFTALFTKAPVSLSIQTADIVTGVDPTYEVTSPGMDADAGRQLCLPTAAGDFGGRRVPRKFMFAEERL